MFEPLAWSGETPGVLRLLDQRLLPDREEWLDRTEVQELFDDIQSLAVRGAPEIGVAAAYGVVLGAQKVEGGDLGELRKGALETAEYLKTSRPTAVNLFWALNRMMARIETSGASDRDGFLAELLEEARSIHKEEHETCLAIGRHGAPLVPEGTGVITHCNAGGLATTGYGTALGVIYAAWDAGKRFTVYADETRPLLQGARLTAWELGKAKIDHVLICDGAAGTALRSGRIGMAVTGADRVAGNGDAANKIGTYSLAVLCKENNVPFYIAAPKSTFDLTLASGDDIPIEERASEEVTNIRGVLQVAPVTTKAWNPAFDVTPNKYITGIITEDGVIEAPTAEKVKAHFEK